MSASIPSRLLRLGLPLALLLLPGCFMDLPPAEDLRRETARKDLQINDLLSRLAHQTERLNRREEEIQLLQRQLEQARAPRPETSFAAVPAADLAQARAALGALARVSARGPALLLELPAEEFFAAGGTTLAGAGEERLEQVAEIVTRRYPEALLLVIAGAEPAPPMRAQPAPQPLQAAADRAVNVLRSLAQYGVPVNQMLAAARSDDPGAARGVELLLLPRQTETAAVLLGGAAAAP